MQRATRRQLFGAALFGGVVLAAALLASPDRAVTQLHALAARPLLFAPALLAAYLLRPLVAWPISALSILLGFLYGPVAIPVALLGAVVTCTPAYLLARRTGNRGLLARAGDSGQRFFAATGDIRGLTGLRLMPLPPDPVSYGAGLSGLSPGRFVLGTALGEFPWVVAAVLLGASLERLTVAGVGGGFPLVVGLAALAVLVLGGPLYRRWRKRRGSPVD
ncbi:TVP38/TMEM64 family protein [Haloglomus halophilum]|uniref:TVP38/TMEM64 family protein n=1 Tax=Haloglomus halophilum TaxID=2962672 RepID=UPI0020C9E65D|nr:VTT domain-containing protein [Haloglomus halophilum]